MTREEKIEEAIRKHGGEEISVGYRAACFRMRHMEPAGPMDEIEQALSEICGLDIHLRVRQIGQSGAWRCSAYLPREADEPEG